MIYKFRNLKHQGEYEDQEFEAESMIDALNLVSKAWFSGSKVIDYVVDSNSRITLLNNQSSGNVIGRIYYWGN